MNITFDLYLDATNPELVRLLARAEFLAAAVRNLAVSEELRDDLNRLNIRRAVRGTTGIEGIEVSEEEAGRIVEHAAGSAVLSPSRAQTEHEVQNAALVMRDISSYLRSSPDAPLNEATVARIHRLLTEGLPYEHNTPGVYRSHAVTVGRYAPPRTRDEIERLMRGFVAWLHGPARGLHPIVRAIAAHYYLVSIHPFGDGNGRTSRAVESYVLFQSGMNVLGFYSLANHYYREQAAYFRHLGELQRDGARDLTPFALFGVQGFVAELEEMWQAALRDVAVTAFIGLARKRLLESGALTAKTGERTYALARTLIEPAAVASIRDGSHAASRLYRRLSDKTLLRDIAYLRDAGLITVSQGLAAADFDALRDHS